MISQGFAKLTSNFIPVVPVQPPQDGITAWEAVLISGIAIAFAVTALALFRWWSE